MSAALAPQPMSAVISRPGATATYLLLSDSGAPDWTGDLRCATIFTSMREATRMALRLPSSLRAYGLPWGGNLTAH
jgi:hypothetical protein